MRRFKLSKRIFALFSVFLIIGVFAAVTICSATMNFVIVVNVLNSSYCDPIYVTRVDSDGTTTGTYSQGSSMVFTDLESLTFLLTLNRFGVYEGYTGFLVYLTSTNDYMGTNLIGNYTDLVADSAGRYYVQSSSDFTFTSETGLNPSLYFSAIPVDYAFVSQNDLGYQVGYDAGYAAAQEYYSAQISELTIQNDMLTAAATSSAQSYQLGKADGFAEGAATHEYIKDATVTTVNGFGSIVAQMLQLEVLGIKVYQIALLACMVPLFFFLLKIATHIGGSS